MAFSSAWPSGLGSAAGPIGAAHPACSPAWSPRGRGGAAGSGSPADKVLRGRRCEHQGGKGSTPNKEVVAGAHLRTVSTVRGGWKMMLLWFPRWWWSSGDRRRRR
jgi:hypothetical protein